VFIYVAAFVKPICLPFDDTALDKYLGEELVVTGWGRTETSEWHMGCFYYRIRARQTTMIKRS
jgi:hypothetical protein